MENAELNITPAMDADRKPAYRENPYDHGPFALRLD
jgi:hypothetical protein